MFDADEAGHRVLEDPEVIVALTGRWGREVLDDRGRIIRRRVAEIVFALPPAGPPELSILEAWTHPRIARMLAAEIARYRSEGRAPLFVLDAPVMFKAGWNGFCDWIVFVDAPRDVRLELARARGWSGADFERREAAQESLAAKQQGADFVLDTSDSRASSVAAVRALGASGRSDPCLVKHV